MKLILAVGAALCLSCSGRGGYRLDSDEDVEASDIETGEEAVDDLVPSEDWVRYDGQAPEIAVFEKEDHITSCMRTRACFPENPQQLATCTSAYAYIVGREVGITLRWVARCVVEAPADCGAIRACLGGGSEPEPCVPLDTPDVCEGSVLNQCSRASGLAFVFDCGDVGMVCFIGSDGSSRCGLGECDDKIFLPSCSGDTLIYCEEGVIIVASCPAAGLACVEEEHGQARCAGSGEACNEAVEGRSCDGDILTGCLGGRIGEVNCAAIVPGWTCGDSEGTKGCVPAGGECTAFPLLGSSIEEECEGEGVVTCLDGYVIVLSCSEYGLGPCVDLGRAARCSPPP